MDDEAERYRLISELTSDFAYSFQVQKDGGIEPKWVAGAFMAITGYTTDEVGDLGGWEHLILEDDMHIPLGQLEALLSGEASTVEYRIVHKNGSHRWVRDHSKPMVDEDGVIIHIYGAVKDITEQKRAEETARMARRLAKFGNYRWDIKNDIVEWSPEIYTIYGADPDEIGPINFVKVREMVHPDDRQLMKESVLEALATKGSFSIIYRVPHTDGRMTYVHSHGEVQVDADGEPVSLFGTAQDITEKILTEDALKQSESLYRDLFENITIGIGISDMEGHPLAGNRSIYEMFGYPEEMILSMEIEELYVDPTVRDRLMNEFSSKGRVTDFEAEFKRYDDSTFWANMSLIKISYNDAPALMATFIDITDRLKAEDARTESEEMYRHLFESAPESITILDLDGVIVDCNKATARISGVPVNSLKGHSFLELGVIREEDLEKYMVMFQRLLEGEEISSLEVPTTGPEGDKWYEVFPGVLRKGDSVTGLQVIARDITDRKASEEEMRRRLMKYELSNGNLYLSKDPTSIEAVDALKDLQNVGHGVVVISREPVEFYRSQLGDDIEHHWLARSEASGAVKAEPESIMGLIDRRPKGTSVLVDRLDYILTENGFEDLVALVNSLRETAYLLDMIVIISLDPSVLEENQLALIEREARPVERMARGVLPDDLFDILKIVFERNIEGQRPSYSVISEESGVSKPTARARIRRLISTGCLKESQKGRSKVLEVTDFGRSLFVK